MKIHLHRLALALSLIFIFGKVFAQSPAANTVTFTAQPAVTLSSATGMQTDQAGGSAVQGAGLEFLIKGTAAANIQILSDATGSDNLTFTRSVNTVNITEVRIRSAAASSTTTNSTTQITTPGGQFSLTSLQVRLIATGSVTLTYTGYKDGIVTGSQNATYTSSAAYVTTAFGAAFTDIDDIVVTGFGTGTGTGAGQDGFRLDNIVIANAPPTIYYVSPQNLTVGTAVSLPVYLASNAIVTSYTVSPALPAGLAITAGTGLISGTPTAVTAAANYTVTANSAAGNRTTTINIAVVSAASSVVDADASTNTVPENSAIGTTVGLTGYAYPANSATNLALSKTAVGSSYENSVTLAANFAVDGNTTSTRWGSAFYDTQDFTVDLGASYNIGRVRIFWETAYGRDYQIQISPDNVTFTTIKSVYNNSTTTNDILNLAGGGVSTTGRYVRMHGINRATQYGYSMYEFEVYQALPLTYSFTAGGNPGALFAINSATGVVTVNNSAIDYETATSRNVTIQATDGTTTTNATFTIAITNVNEAPVITSNGGGATATISVSDNTTAVTTVTATDVDAGDTQTYSISGGADAGKFNMTAGGVLTFNSIPNYASPGSAAGSNAYTVAVTVTDAGGLTAVQTLTVNVTSSAFLSAYAYRMPVTLNTVTAASTYTITSDQTNFPVLLKITDPALVYSSASCANKVQNPNGPAYDFAFTTAASNTELNYQVESYDQTNGTLLVWVRVPLLTYASNTSLFFYYGNATSTAATHTTSFATNTWTGATAASTNYSGVWHFNEAPSTASATLLDATSAGSNLKAYNVGTVAQNTTSVIGNGIQLTGSNVSSAIAGYPALNTSLSMSAWVKFATAPANNQNLMVLVQPGTAADQLGFRSSANPALTNYGGAVLVTSAAAASVATWHHVVYTYNSTGTVNSIYVDGVLRNTAAATPQTGPPTNIFFGDYTNGSTETLTGFVDEARVIYTTLSADWIKFEYANESSPATFATAGTATTDPTNVLTIPGGVIYSTANGTVYTPNVTGVSATPTGNGKESFIITGNTNLPATASAYGLTVNSGVTLSVNGQTINVACNVVNNGSIVYGTTASSITFNGSSAAQTYTAAATSNTASVGTLTVNNSAGGTVTLSGGPVDVYNQLVVTKGNLVIAGTTTFTLKSTATLTASVPTYGAGYTVTGTVNAERFIPGGAGTRGYRLLSSPVSSQTVSSINMFDFIEPAKTTFISGPGGTNTVGVVNNNGFDGSPNNNSAVLVYKESDTDPISRNVLASDYKGTASINEYIPMGNGVLFFFRGNRTLVQSGTPTGGNSFVSPYPYPNSATLNFKGTLVTGNVVVNRPVFNATSPLNYYNVKGTAFAPSATLTVTGFLGTMSFTNNSLTRSGFNLVGNPYASTIDLEKILLTNMTGTNPTIYTLNNVTGNGFGTYKLSGTGTGASSTNGTALNGASRYALSGEGFFVKAASAAATVTFQEAAKTTYPAGASGTVTGSPTVFSIVQKNPAIRIKLVQDTTLYNETLLSFKDDGNNSFTNDDVAYLPAPSQVVFMYSTTPEGAPCVINNMGKLETVPPIKLYAEGGVTGIYQMKFSGMESIDSYYRIFLTDSFTKDSLEITANPNYTFNINKANAATFGANRFSLVVYHSIPGVYQLVKFTGEKPAQSAGVVLNWETKNESDVITFNVERSNDGGKTYANLGTVQSAGKGSYTFTDVAPSAATDNIYRLKQADLNDAVTYSTLVDIKIQDILGITVNSIIVYPNPTTGIINVNVSKPVMGQVQLQIVNSTGKIVKKSIFDASQHFQENVSELLYGTYIINLFETASGKKVATAKFIKR